MSGKFKINPSLIIFFSFLLLYILLPNNNQGYDSYSYAISIRDGHDLFHPHHLIYNLFGLLIYHIFKFTGLGCMKILSLINSILGALTLLFIFKILREKTSDYLAAVGTVISGLLFSFWYYSASVEVNMPALLCAVIALYILINKPPNGFNSIIAYIFISLAILFHQIIVLAVIPILIYDANRRKSYAGAIKYAIPGLAAGFVIYLLVALNQAEVKSLSGIYRWLTFYGHLGAWGTLGFSNFSNAGWGKIKTFFGGDLIREIYYAGNWSVSILLYLIGIALVWIGLTWLFLLTLYKLFRQPDNSRLLLLALVIIFSLFAFWWAPADDGFWLYPVILLIIFIFSYDFRKPIFTIITSVIVVLLAVINISCEFIPSSNRNNSYIIQGVEAFKRLNLGEHDLVITNYSQIRLAYEYYTGIHVPTTCLMYLNAGDKDRITAEYIDRIQQAVKTGRVIMFDDEIHPASYRGYLFERFEPDEYRNVYDQFKNNLAVVDSISVHGRKTYLYEFVLIE
jgi:hypothetical protein